MKKNLFIYCLILLISFSCDNKREKIFEDMSTHGKVINIHSATLNEEREIWIYYPVNVSPETDVPYPVVYLLDPESNFSPVTEMIELFSGDEINGELSKMIVVGIPSRDRIHDLTPSNDLNPSESSAVPLNDGDFINSGGAEKLTLFIRDELMPYIDSTYHTSGFKILAGHSFGGLTVSNALLFYPDLFNGYIAADPSIWWNHQEIIKQADTVVKKTDFKDTYFFYANSSSASKFAKTIKDPAVRNPYHSELNFGGAFADNRQNINGFTWIHYERENHGSIPLIALYDGLKIMSEVYRNSNSYKSITATSSLISDSVNQGNESIQKEQKPVYVNEVKSKLKELSTVKTKISDDNNSLMVYDDSIHTSANLYKLMGEIYEFKGDKERAHMNYEKSLLFDPENKSKKSRIKRLLGLKN